MNESGLLSAGLFVEAVGAETLEQGVMPGDMPTALLGSSFLTGNSHRNANIGKGTTLGAVHMIMAIGSLIEPAGLIREREFRNQVMLCQKVKCAIHRAIGDRWVTLTNPLEYLAGSQMLIGTLNLFQDDGSLSSISVCPSDGAGHENLLITLCKLRAGEVRNDSHLRMILVRLHIKV